MEKIDESGLMHENVNKKICRHSITECADKRTLQQSFHQSV